MTDTKKLRERIGSEFDNEATLSGEELTALLDEIEVYRGLTDERYNSYVGRLELEIAAKDAEIERLRGQLAIVMANSGAAHERAACAEDALAAMTAARDEACRTGGGVSERAPCVRCGMILYTGEGRVLVSFTPDELELQALASPDKNVSDRLLCALGLLDAERETRVRKEREWAPDPETECRVCGVRANKDGERWHGKGCYAVSESGGGVDYP